MRRMMPRARRDGDVGVTFSTIETTPKRDVQNVSRNTSRDYKLNCLMCLMSCVSICHYVCFNRPQRRWFKLHWFKKSPPRNFLIFFPNGSEFLVWILHAYYIHIPIYARLHFLFNYLQIRRSYAILSATAIIMLKMSTIGRNAHWVVAFNMA